MEREKDQNTFVKMVTVNTDTVVMKIFYSLEFNVRKIKGSEIEIVELHMSPYHRKTHFLKYVLKG